MKKSFQLSYALGLLFFALFNTSCSEKKVEQAIEIAITKKTIEGDTTQSLATLNIEGMTCEVGCGGFISKKLSEMTGVLSAEVVFEENKAKVKYDDLKISEKEIIAEIQKLNEGQYKVTKVEIEKTVKKIVS
jgi:mercuric ion binding protein